MTTYKVVNGCLVRLPNGAIVIVQDKESAELLCQFVDKVIDPAKAGSDREWNWEQAIGKRMNSLPNGTTVDRAMGGGWKIRLADGSEYGRYVDLYEALEATGIRR